MKRLFALMALCLATVAQAAPMRYDFEYTAIGGGVLSGSLMGELQADNNTIVVSSILDFAKFNGVDGPTLPYVYYYPGNGPDPIVSLDGSVMNIVACTSIECSAFYGDGFLFQVAVGGAQVLSGDRFGSLGEDYDRASWQLQAAGVPAPATLALLGIGLAGLGIARRRRAQ